MYKPDITCATETWLKPNVTPIQNSSDKTGCYKNKELGLKITFNVKLSIQIMLLYNYG